MYFKTKYIIDFFMYDYGILWLRHFVYYPYNKTVAMKYEHANNLEESFLKTT